MANINNSNPNNLFVYSPLTPLQKCAGKRIYQWYKTCSEMRAAEHKIRRQLFNRNIDENKPRFFAIRVVTAGAYQKLKLDVLSILNFYESDEGAEFIEGEELAEDNRDRWKNILHKIPPEYGHTPIAIRDHEGELQAVAVVSPEYPNAPLTLHLLATSPLNLGEDGKYRGAGTAAFEDAVFLCIRRRHASMEFFAGLSSVDFYKKKLGIPLEHSHGCLRFHQFAAFLEAHGGKAIPGTPT